MLVVISDIHFVDGTAGEHNLPYGAFESVFLSDIAFLAKEKEAKEIRLLLLGDIVDVTRSEQWFDLKLRDRPWGASGLADIANPRAGSATEEQTLKILGQVSDDDLKEPERPASLAENTVLYKNWDTFKLFREFEQQLKMKFAMDIPVKIIYVLGNHDRLCNLYPSVRKNLQKILGLTVESDTVLGDVNGEWRYLYDFKDETYGVYARHGHQFDAWNYGGRNDYTPEGHLQAPIGDVLTTEFAAKIPWMLASLKKDYPEISDDLIKNVKDIDNVRPLSRVMEWIYYRIKSEDSIQIRKALDEAFDRVIRELLDNDFVKKWRSPATHIDEALRLASSRWLNWIPKRLLDLLDAEDLLPLIMGLTSESPDPDKDIYAQAAYKENIWKEDDNFRFLLYGHTHAPLQIPLDRKEDREVIYLNTGTWRNRIYKTIGLDKSPDFIELKQMTYLIFYGKDEDNDNKVAGTLSFDVWTGMKKKYYG